MTLLDSSLEGRVVRRLLATLERDGVTAWGRFIYEGWSQTRPHKHNWAILQLSLLADDDLIDEAMAALGRWRGAEHSAITAHLLAAQWHGSHTSTRWLGYWSAHLPSPGARAAARQLLGRVAFKNGVSLHELRAELAPFIAEEREERLLGAELEPGVERQRLLFELERSWLSGRTWQGEAILRLSCRQRYLEGERLLLRRADGTLCRLVGSSIVDLDGRDVSPEGRLTLAHPLELAPNQLTGLAPSLGNPTAFTQLSRDTYSPSQLPELLGRRLGARALAQFRRKHRWLHGEPMDGGIVYSDSLHLHSRGIVVTLHHSGYGIGTSETDELVRVLGLTFSDLDGAPIGAGSVPPVAYSELHRSLLEAFERA